MKTLFLVRHAKSSWAEAGLSDHDRTLNERGRRDAPEMGRRLKQQQARPDRIVSSTALRALATARLLAGALDLPPERVVPDKRLYASSAQVLLDIVRNLDDQLDSVMLVGHNPEMSELARQLSAEIPDLPTCAVAQMEFEVATWVDIGDREPAQTAFDFPKSGRGQEPVGG